MYIQEEGGRAKKAYNNSKKDKSTKEQLRYDKQYIYTSHTILSPLPLAIVIRHGYA